MNRVGVSNAIAVDYVGPTGALVGSIMQESAYGKKVSDRRKISCRIDGSMMRSIDRSGSWINSSQGRVDG